MKSMHLAARAAHQVPSIGCQHPIPKMPVHAAWGASS